MYNDAREVNDMLAYVNKKASTFRKADGTLMAEVGRVAMLDSIIAEAIVINAGLLAQLKAAVATLRGSAAKDDEMHITLGEKIVEKGEDYIESEKQGWALLLRLE